MNTNLGTVFKEENSHNVQPSGLVEKQEASLFPLFFSSIFCKDIYWANILLTDGWCAQDNGFT